MSFLKKYKKQFEDAKGKYMPEEKKTEAQTGSDYAPTGSTPGQQHLTPAVPPGWAATWDAPNNRWTYLEQSTGRTQIEHPDPANYGGQFMPPGGPVLDKDGKPKEDKNGPLAGAAGGLATGAFGAKLMGLAKKKAAMVTAATVTVIMAVMRKKEVMKRTVVEETNNVYSTIYESLLFHVSFPIHCSLIKAHG
ncbi:MAG: hypothetical protein LQ341_004610 [Variospora aurantia]|nr:MAG: hypothetical protein LQ341_004610 [Variospora aurantia]